MLADLLHSQGLRQLSHTISPSLQFRFKIQKEKKKEKHSSSAKCSHQQSPSEPLQEGHRALSLQTGADTCTTEFRGSQHQGKTHSSSLLEVLGEALCLKTALFSFPGLLPARCEGAGHIDHGA